MERNIKELVQRMTLEEKAGMCSGLDFWHLKGVERLGIPSIMVTDGPHGLRKQDGSADHLGLTSSVPATCFPSAAGLASSWDKELARQVGVALGEECQAEDVAVLLGPGVNIKRSRWAGVTLNTFPKIRCYLRRWLPVIFKVCRARVWVRLSNTLQLIIRKNGVCRLMR